MESTIAVFIPIIFFLVFGFVISISLMLRSKEKQMMIEKGLSAEQIMEFFRQKEKDSKNKYYLLKSGIILIFLVIGGVIGNMIDRAFFFQYEIFEGRRLYHDDPVYGVWFAFLGLGIGAIVAHFVAKKAETKDNEKS
jgi:hypothetical protein